MNKALLAGALATLLVGVAPENRRAVLAKAVESGAFTETLKGEQGQATTDLQRELMDYYKGGNTLPGTVDGEEDQRGEDGAGPIVVAQSARCVQHCANRINTPWYGTCIQMCEEGKGDSKRK